MPNLCRSGERKIVKVRGGDGPKVMTSSRDNRAGAPVNSHVCDSMCKGHLSAAVTLFLHFERRMED